MAIEIVVPRLGWSMEEGVFQEWLVEDGANVKPGDALFVLESDKAAQEVESFDAGILAIPGDAPKAGDKVVVGQMLGYLLAQGETMPENAKRIAAPSGPALAPPGPTAIPQVEVAPPPARDRTLVTPRARRRARELKVDLATASIKGTGRGGRVRERDILRSVQAFQNDGSRTVVFMTARAVATEFDVMVASIARQKRSDYSRIDLLRRLLSVALSEHPELNSGDAIEIGNTFGMTDFTGRRVENWVPVVPTNAVAALGIGCASGKPQEFPLNLSFEASHVSLEVAAGFLDRLCELIESPVLALVR